MSAERPSEVEALAKVIVGHQRIPMYGHIPNIHRCSGGCAELRSETDGPNSPRHAQHVAGQILASDYLADHDARVRAEALREFANSIVTPGPDDDGPTLYAVWCAANDRADRLMAGEGA